MSKRVLVIDGPDGIKTRAWNADTRRSLDIDTEDAEALEEGETLFRELDGIYLEDDYE